MLDFTTFEYAIKFTGWHDEQFLPQRLLSLFYILVTLQKKKIFEKIDDSDKLAEDLIQALTQGIISFTLVLSREEGKPKDYIAAIRHCPVWQSVAISTGWPGHQIYFEALKRPDDTFEYLIHNRGGGVSGNHLVLPDDPAAPKHARKVRTFYLGVFPIENIEVQAHIMAIGNRHITRAETINLLYDKEKSLASEQVDLTAGAGAVAGVGGGGAVTSPAGTRLVDLPVQHGGHCVFDSHSAFLARYFGEDFLNFVIRQELILLMVRQRSLSILKSVLLAHPIMADKSLSGFVKQKLIHMGGESAAFDKAPKEVVWDEEEDDAPLPNPVGDDWKDQLIGQYAVLNFTDVFGEVYEFVDHRYWQHITDIDESGKERIVSTIRHQSVSLLQYLKDNRQPVIIAEAPMGYGKTSTQKHLAKLWASDSEAGENLREQYEYCFMIPLTNINNSRYAPHEQTIAHVVARECLGKNLNETELAQMMIHLAQSKVLWLFDGLDEFKLSREQWPEGLASILESTIGLHQVIVTGRPDRTLDLSLASVWQIQPFNVGQIKAMVRQKLNYDQLVTLLDYFKLNLPDYQEVNGSNAGYLSTPLCLQMVIRIVVEEGLTFGRSLTMFDLFFDIERLLEERYLDRLNFPRVGIPAEMIKGFLSPMRKILGELALDQDVESEEIQPFRDQLHQLGVIRISEDYSSTLFYHPSYESYYVARYCFDLVQRSPDKFAGFLKQNKYHPRYRQAWPMFIGLC